MPRVIGIDPLKDQLVHHPGPPVRDEDPRARREAGIGAHGDLERPEGRALAAGEPEPGVVEEAGRHRVGARVRLAKKDPLLDGGQAHVDDRPGPGEQAEEAKGNSKDNVKDEKLTEDQQKAKEEAAKAKQPADARAQRLIAGLAGWDARATAESVETSFVEYARRALFVRLLQPYLGDEVTKYELWEPQSVYNDVWWRDKVFLENVLRERPAAWLPSGFANYDELLMASADDAVAALQKQTGQATESEWNWGRLHPLDMIHPLGRAGLLHRMLSIGPYEQGGTIDTVRAMGVGHGPAMRFVADLANFDGSLMEIPTGESGQYGSPYYRDQFTEWFAGRGIPAAFSIAAEDAARAHRLTLLPADRK